MNKRLYPIEEEKFKSLVEPYIKQQYKRPGRPVGISHYKFFYAILYVVRKGIAWRDLPEEYGVWHTIYTRFKRWSVNGIFWNLVYKLQQMKCILVDVALVDSSTVPL